ncbi:hypothetical protein O4G76_19675, partial [Limimaricola sp. G21655-S1]|nr:hypothetical protein [Limimaricola sp. G21655-S1]
MTYYTFKNSVKTWQTGYSSTNPKLQLMNDEYMPAGTWEWAIFEGDFSDNIFSPGEMVFVAPVDFSGVYSVGDRREVEFSGVTDVDSDGYFGDMVFRHYSRYYVLTDSDEYIDFDPYSTEVTVLSQSVGWAAERSGYFSSADTVAPELTSLILPERLDLSAGPAQFDVSATAFDDKSGVADVVVWLDNSISYSWLGSEVYSPYSLLGLFDSSDWSDGHASNSYMVATTNQPGTYGVTRVVVEDMQGNERTYTAADLEAMGVNTSIELIGTTEDTVAPELTSLSLPERLDLSAGPAQFDVSATAFDDKSGVADVVVWLDNSISYSWLGSEVYSPYSLLGLFDSSDWSDGHASNSYMVATTNQPGTYGVTRVVVEDMQGNERTYTAADLEAMGVNTSIELGFGPAKLNNVPTSVQLSNQVVRENVAGATIGQLTVTDPDAGDTHSFTVSDDRFEVVDGALKLKSGVLLDYEAGATVPVDVTATDAAGLSLTQRFDVTVSNVNEAATAVRLSSATVRENAAGATIGQLTVTDPDARDSHSFTVSDTRFEVVGGALKLKAGVSLDHEAGATVPVEVTMTDAAGLSLTQRFDVTVSNVNEAATAVRLSSATVRENAAGATIGQLTVTDPDARDSHSFTVSDTRFEVVDGALKLKAGVSLDHEAEATVPVDVTATDAAGLSLTQRFTLAVQDVVEDVLPPVDEEETGGSSGDTPKGTKGNDVLVGNGGKDKLVGGAGHDDLTGGAGNDKLLGGKGNDTLAGDEGNDKLVGGGGRDVLDGGVGRDKLLGGGGNDKLSGGEGNDRLIGGGGKDRLDGGAGNDKMKGGGGA